MKKLRRWREQYRDWCLLRLIKSSGGVVFMGHNGEMCKWVNKLGFDYFLSGDDECRAFRLKEQGRIKATEEYYYTQRNAYKIYDYVKN